MRPAARLELRVALSWQEVPLPQVLLASAMPA